METAAVVFDRQLELLSVHPSRQSHFFGSRVFERIVHRFFRNEEKVVSGLWRQWCIGNPFGLFDAASDTCVCEVLDRKLAEV